MSPYPRCRAGSAAGPVRSDYSRRSDRGRTMAARPGAELITVIFAMNAAADECSKHFWGNRVFLPAKGSCFRQDAYPSITLMRAYAEQAPKETAPCLLDDGQHEWARA